MDDVSLTEEVYGIIVSLDGDIDEKTGARLRKTTHILSRQILTQSMVVYLVSLFAISPDFPSDLLVSVSSYFTADENDTSDPSSMVLLLPRCTCQMNSPTAGLPSAGSSVTVPLTSFAFN